METQKHHRSKLIRVGAITFATLAVLIAAYIFLRPAPILRFSWVESYQAKNFQAVIKAYGEETGVKTIYGRYTEEDYPTFLIRTAAAKDEDKLTDIAIASPLFFKQNPDFFLPITDFIREQNVHGTMVAQFVDASARHPDRDNEYIGLPLMGGTTILVYRKDLFEDEAHTAAFAEQYGYDLAVPRLWDDIHDVAEYFTKPEQDMVGFSMPFSWHDLSASKSTESIWFSHTEYSGQRYRNFYEATESSIAFDTFSMLHTWAPYLSRSAITGGSQVALADFAAGKTAMTLLDSDYLVLLENPLFNTHLENTGYALAPAGDAGRTTPALGALMGIINHSKSKEALDFFVWLNTPHAQEIWADAGGLSSFNSTLQSQKFLHARPYNSVYKDALEYTIPIFPTPATPDELLLINGSLQDFLLNHQNYTPETFKTQLLKKLR